MPLFAIRRQLATDDVLHPGRIAGVMGGRDQWVEGTIKPPEIYRTRLLPGLEFSCADVFRAAGLT